MPLHAPIGHRGAQYRALDFMGTVKGDHAWVFVGQLRKELHANQLAGLLADLVGVDPLLVVKKVQCMHVLLRSRTEAAQVLALNTRLLLDYGGVWYAKSNAEMELMEAEALRNQRHHLPKSRVTIESCENPPQLFGAIGHFLPPSLPSIL